MSNLIRATTDFSLTQFQHASKNMGRLHRPDLFRIRMRAIGGKGGNGYERRNNIGGNGGRVCLVGTGNKKYKTMEQVQKRLMQNLSYQEKLGHLKLSSREEREELKAQLHANGQRAPNTINLRGGNGENCSKMTGSGLHGKDVHFEVPIGVEIFEDIYAKLPPDPSKPRFKQKKLVDTVRHGSVEFPGQLLTIAYGGNAGNFSNAYKGQRGEDRRFFMFKREYADLAIVGMSNSGKTTLLQQLTGRRKGSFISSGVHSTLGLQKGMIKFDDGVQCSVIDTPALDQISAFMLSTTVLRAKTIVLLVDPFGFQENVESEPYSAFETIVLFEEIFREHFKGDREAKLLLAFNKYDLPGAEEKMQECLAEYNIHDERLNFEKVLAVSAHKKQGLEPLKTMARAAGDNYFEKYILGRDHKILMASGKKWPPPSIKGPKAPVLTDIPREKLLREEFGHPKLGGDMNHPDNRPLAPGPIQAFSNFVDDKKKEKLQRYKDKRRQRLEKGLGRQFLGAGLTNAEAEEQDMMIQAGGHFEKGHKLLGQKDLTNRHLPNAIKNRELEEPLTFENLVIDHTPESSNQQPIHKNTKKS